ncbi:MAG: virulence-associated E family protein [Ruminococcus sp.]|nr:virulence-associated E family protein [Ruminococcus sp.]
MTGRTLSLKKSCRISWEILTDNRVKLHLEKEYSLVTSINGINQVCSIIANDNSYHPIKEYLEAVKYDEKPRLKSVFTDFLGATNNIYTQSVAVITFVGAVARIFEPGVKFDTCTVLVGKQVSTARISMKAYKVNGLSSWAAELSYR